MTATLVPAAIALPMARPLTRRLPLPVSRCGYALAPVPVGNNDAERPLLSPKQDSRQIECKAMSPDTGHRASFSETTLQSLAGKLATQGGERCHRILREGPRRTLVLRAIGRSHRTARPRSGRPRRAARHLRAQPAGVDRRLPRHATQRRRAGSARHPACRAHLAARAAGQRRTAALHDFCRGRSAARAVRKGRCRDPGPRLRERCRCA